METKEKKEKKPSEPKFLNLHEYQKNFEAELRGQKQMNWIKTINSHFRVLFKFRDQKNYMLIGAGTVFKIVDHDTAILAFLKALDSEEQIVSFNVKNALRIKFYSK